jgi:type IV secretory pathway TrbL component
VLLAAVLLAAVLLAAALVAVVLRAAAAVTAAACARAAAWIRARVPPRQTWQMASARASAASAGRGGSASPSSRVTIAVTWAFPAVPEPVTAALTSLGV